MLFSVDRLALSSPSRDARARARAPIKNAHPDRGRHRRRRVSRQGYTNSVPEPSRGKKGAPATGQAAPGTKVGRGTAIRAPKPPGKCRLTGGGIGAGSLSDLGVRHEEKSGLSHVLGNFEDNCGAI